MAISRLAPSPPASTAWCCQVVTMPAPRSIPGERVWPGLGGLLSFQEAEHGPGLLPPRPSFTFGSKPCPHPRAEPPNPTPDPPAKAPSYKPRSMCK